MNEQWSNGWPSKPGKYWFYGWPYKEEKRERPPELHFVEVIKISNGLMVVRSGAFWFKSEWGGEGMFYEIDLPSLPDLS